MVKDRHYAIEFTVQALLRQGLISREQHTEILSRGISRKTKLSAKSTANR